MRHGLAILVLAAATTPVSAQVVSTAQYGNQRLGANVHETVLTPGNVEPSQFGRVARLELDGDVYAQPLYVPTAFSGVNGSRVVRDLLVVASEAGSVYAFDVGALAAEAVWHRRLIGDGDGSVPVSFQDVLCPFIRPAIGITPTPVIDTTTGTVYVLVRSKTRDESGRWRFVQRLHALDVHTGRDRHAPAQIEASVAGTGRGSRAGRVEFDPLRENPRPALLLDRGVVYAAWASSCDVAPYHGWVMAYDAATLRQIGALNTSPDGGEAGIWQGDAGLAADDAGNVYAVTGNGSFGPRPAIRNYGNSVLQIHRSGDSLVMRSAFTPPNEAALTQEDADLGSSGPMLLPTDSATRQPLVFFTGKDGMSYLIARPTLSYVSGPVPPARQVLKTSSAGFGASAYWNSHLYVWGSDTTLLAFSLHDGRLQPAPVAAPTRTADPGAIPVVSANGDRDGIVWAVETRRWRGADQPAVLHAYAAADVRRELFSSEMNSTRDRMGLATRFAFPTVANGRVFVGAKNEVDVFGLLSR